MRRSSTLCCLVNAVMLALMNAGICMSDMVSACSVGYVKDNLCTDMTQVEQSLGGAYLPVVCRAHDDEVVYMQLDNRLSTDSIEVALQKALDGCKAARHYIETAIRAHMNS